MFARTESRIGRPGCYAVASLSSTKRLWTDQEKARLPCLRPFGSLSVLCQALSEWLTVRHQEGVGEWPAILASDEDQVSVQEEPFGTLEAWRTWADREELWPHHSLETRQSSTHQSQEDIEEWLAEPLECLFASGREQEFEDGMESDFSNKLVSTVRTYGNPAVKVIADLIINEKVNAAVASEALRWLGELEDQETRCSRLWLLEKALESQSSSVRDGALLGIASMDDPAAIQALERAIQEERIGQLRKFMQEVLLQLEETRQCRSS